jgi:hypothetical protein
MNKIVIVALVMLLNITGFAQIPSDTTLSIEIISGSKTPVPIPRIFSLNGYVGVVSNTQPDVLYEFQYKQNRTNWISLGFMPGPEIGTHMLIFNIPTNLVAPNSRIVSTKKFRVRSWKDRGDEDIPYWWLIKYFGDVDIDVFSSPMNDGWSILQNYQNGMNPFKWYPPPEEAEFNLEFQKNSDAKHTNAVLTILCNTRKVPDLYTIERASRTTEIYQPIGQLPGRQDVWNRYVDTNVDFFPEPIYRVHAHYPEPPLPFAELNEVTPKSIRNTILSVTAIPQTNGYELTVHHPLIRARYLLLVRDKNDRQWRASGYFVSGTNRNSVCLHIDKKGMMTDTQSPITMPPVNFLPDVVQPEFTAGWGEDTDGDGLPDIYEVLVTHTDPDDADTGGTGMRVLHPVFGNRLSFRMGFTPFTDWNTSSTGFVWGKTLWSKEVDVDIIP